MAAIRYTGTWSRSRYDAHERGLDDIYIAGIPAGIDLFGSSDLTYALWTPSAPIPEPSTATIFGFGLVGLSLWSRRRA